MKNDIYGVKFALVLQTKLTKGRFFLKIGKKFIRININAKILVSQWFRTLGCPRQLDPRNSPKFWDRFAEGFRVLGVSRFAFAF